MTAQVTLQYNGYMPDTNTRAHVIVATATAKKNPAAVALGRLGGLKGGKARAAKLSASQRSEIAKKAANQRWKKI